MKKHILCLGDSNTHGYCADPADCAEKSRELAYHYKLKAELLSCHFMDADGCEFNRIDYMHLTKKGHAQLAERFAALVPQLVEKVSPL